MEIKVYKEGHDEVWFHYTKDMDPEIEDRGVNGFSIGYYGEDEDGNDGYCVCDYPSGYFYVTIEEEDYVITKKEDAPSHDDDILELKYTIKGVTLEAEDIIKIHNYYKEYSIAEYLVYTRHIAVKLAFYLAPMVLNLVEEYEYSEEAAIAEILGEINNNEEETD